MGVGLSYFQFISKNWIETEKYFLSYQVESLSFFSGKNSVGLRIAFSEVNIYFNDFDGYLIQNAALVPLGGKWKFSTIHRHIKLITSSSSLPTPGDLIRMLVSEKAGNFDGQFTWVWQ